MVRVGVMGGTFDPIHLGHLAAAEGAAYLAGLDRVLFVPNRQSPLKQEFPPTDPRHRAEMVRLAIAGNPRFECSELELERTGPSYTIETVRSLRRLQPHWQLFWIVGFDSLLELPRWREFEQLLSEVEFLAISRPGFGAGDRERALATLPGALAERVRIFEVPGVDVSATDLRRLAAAGYPLRYLVPEAVADYIGRNRLYRE